MNNQEMIEIKIRRNEDAIDRLNKDVSLDFWHKERMIDYHRQRILRWKGRK